jgi:hypothetical protein
MIKKSIHNNLTNPNSNKKGGVSHCGLAIYTKKYHPEGKRRIIGNSNISPCKKYNLQKFF